ncbi:hypothetical protein [Pontibacter kalidii]|uniref:hypothetical protein n=1 Tax=Pontibacter kalidii TaxID=2592049 RepID=UPI00225AB067|nr:hypothetical protein [Pontibacter kalidii]
MFRHLPSLYREFPARRVRPYSAMECRFVELGFSEAEIGWLWVHEEHGLVIEVFGSFSGTMFEGIIPKCLLYHKGQRGDVSSFEGIARGSEKEVASVAERMMAERCLG